MVQMQSDLGGRSMYWVMIDTVTGQCWVLDSAEIRGTPRWRPLPKPA